MKSINIVLIMLLMGATSCYGGIVYPTAKITVKAVDEQKNPIENVDVLFMFYTDSGRGHGWGLETEFVRGKTNNQGLFTAKKSTSSRCGMKLRKEGYYSSSMSYCFKKSSMLNRWEPWNPTVEIKLKEKRNPIPMYAKRTGGIKVPVLEKPIGYDLEKGDWVAPYGKGVISDFIFNCKARDTSRDDWACSYTLTFSNEHDGIQEFIPKKNDQSIYEWPYEAPEDGYEPKITWSSSYFKGKEKTDYKKGEKNIFRVRTKVDEKGNIIEAKYGKMGGIEMFPNGKIYFGYRFNPTGTRNLEYDPKKPLFKWKTDREWSKYEITAP